MTLTLEEPTMLHEFAYDQESEGLSPRTVAEYVRLLSKLPFELPGTVAEAKAYLAERRQKVSAATLHYETRALRRFGKWYADTHGTANPYKTLKLPKVPKPLPGRVATEELVNGLIQRMRLEMRYRGADRPATTRNMAIIRVLQTTGARRSEVARLRLDDVDLTARRLAIRESKNDEARYVPLADRTAEAIRAWTWHRLEWRAAEHATALFVSRDGQPLSSNGIALMLKRVSKQFDIEPPLNAHSFRRGLAHMWAANGGLDDSLMAIAGWRNPTMPARYRAELTAERAHDDYERILNQRF